MKKSVIFAGMALLTLAACNKTPNVEPQPVDFSQYAVRVEPVITRATETNFEKGDQIGLSIVRATGDYATNKQLTYDGTAFSGDLNWYDEGAEESTLKAYYPYNATEALPTRFTVQADQSKGTAASDFVSAVKENVLPSANAVSMVFKHRLSRLVVTVKNNSGAEIETVQFQEIIPVALIDADLTAKVDENAKWQTITAFADGDKYYAIVPGQTVAPIVVVTAGGKELSQQLVEVTLEPGKQYSVSIVVNKEEIKVVLAGEIENWTDGGEITGDGPSFEEKLEDGYFTYDGVKYNVVKMKDGKWWMAQNLAYLPEGYTPATGRAHLRRIHDRRRRDCRQWLSVPVGSRSGTEGWRPDERGRGQGPGRRPGHLPEGLACPDAGRYHRPRGQVRRREYQHRGPVLRRRQRFHRQTERGRLQHGRFRRHFHPGQHQDRRFLHGLGLRLS